MNRPTPTLLVKKILPTFAAGIALAILAGCSDGGGSQDDVATFEVKRGNMVVDVLVGGSIHALESLEIRSQIKLNDGVKILEIIEEGYEVTPEDVKKGKVLVRLDPSTIEQRLVDHEVEFQQTRSAYTEARQELEIQQSENTSEIKLVRQAARFSLLDFQKFVGEKAAREILRSLDLPYDNDTLEKYEQDALRMIIDSFNEEELKLSETEEDPTQDLAEASVEDDGSSSENTPPPAADTDETPATAGLDISPIAADESTSLASKVDFGRYLTGNKLGEGQAEQTMRRLHDEALVAKTELGVVAESVEGAKRLREKEFITRTTLENELVSLEKAKLTLQTAETELDLFRDYEFPKEAEKMLSNYEESLLELVREHREGVAQLAKRESQYRSARRRYELELKQRLDLEEQLASCIIRAEKPGLVSYGGKDRSYYNSRYYESITEGATLKMGQPVITIPDMSRLAVDVEIHESHVKKVALGQKAKITVEAEAGRSLDGRVTKLAVLPDSNASRYNPSLKVYPATIEIEGSHDWLKPGMTAKVEIIVKELDEIVYIPVQAVFVKDDAHFCYVKKGASDYERRLVATGDHNDEFIEIPEGLEEGDVVYLKAPDGFDRATEELPEASGLTGELKKKKEEGGSA